MSVCRGCWSDGLSDRPGVVLMSTGEKPMVMHRREVLCDVTEPHEMTTCALFSPAQRRVTPDLPPPTRPPDWWRDYVHRLHAEMYR